MHDPMAVAFEIRRPWPRIRKARHASDRVRSFSWPFARLWGVVAYWPALITVWRVEPNGRDSGEVCRNPRRWKWHLRHLRLQLHPWQRFRRWAFTRCAWCGGKSRRNDYVNVSHSGWGDPDRAKHWWHGEPNLFHRDCSAIERAHHTCICALTEGSWAHSPLSGLPWGHCSACDGFRPMGLRDDPELAIRLETTELLRSIPVGGRDSKVVKRVEMLWKLHRATRPAEVG